MEGKMVNQYTKKIPYKVYKEAMEAVIPIAESFADKDLGKLTTEEVIKIKNLCSVVEDYYVSHKKWRSLDAFEKAYFRVARFGTIYHRHSVGIRVLGKRQPELLKK